MRSSITALPLFVFLAAATNSTRTGCSRTPPLAPGSSKNFTLTSSGRTREYILYLPASYNPSQRAPLVLNFPGHGDSDAFQQTLTLLDEPFFNSDHVVVYPQGVHGTDGKSAFTGAPYSDPHVDDLKFTDDLLDSLQQEFCIDATRIFATGKSNGGGFVNQLACHPQSARAFAPVAGAYYLGFEADGPACKPSRSPQPFLEIHGYNDSVIPYNGGKDHGAMLPHVFDFVAQWSIRNGCGPGAVSNKTTQDNNLVDVFDFGCSTMHYAVRNADHVWESTVGNADTAMFKFGPSAINASTVVMDFFRSAPSLPQS